MVLLFIRVLSQIHHFMFLLLLLSRSQREERGAEGSIGKEEQSLLIVRRGKIDERGEGEDIPKMGMVRMKIGIIEKAEEAEAAEVGNRLISGAEVEVEIEEIDRLIRTSVGCGYANLTDGQTDFLRSVPPPGNPISLP
jgi:hypothetical protein